MASTQYTLSFNDAKSHYVHVEISIDNVNPDTYKDYIDFVIPVWTPGSYKVREFSQNVEGFNASSDKGQLEVLRESKNKWRILEIYNSSLKIEYDVYAFEKSARQSYVDEFYAFIHGVSVFGYAEGHQHEEIII